MCGGSFHVLGVGKASFHVLEVAKILIPIKSHVYIPPLESDKSIRSNPCRQELPVLANARSKGWF